jgi:hypothetical protein
MAPQNGSGTPGKSYWTLSWSRESAPRKSKWRASARRSSPRELESVQPIRVTSVAAGVGLPGVRLPEDYIRELMEISYGTTVVTQEHNTP